MVCAVLDLFTCTGGCLFQQAALILLPSSIQLLFFHNLLHNFVQKLFIYIKKKTHACVPYYVVFSHFVIMGFY